jgi:isopentenyl diphosphate isomerase/L-lactate dehydrogenase-like FMN-dependent dehydrogenase
LVNAPAASVVVRVETLRAELETAMMLTGVARLSEIERSLLY